MLFYDKINVVIKMRNRSELREVAMKCLYQVYIMEPTNIEFNVDDIIKEQIEVEN